MDQNMAKYGLKYFFNNFLALNLIERSKIEIKLYLNLKLK